VGWVKALVGKTVALDTAPLIYYVEENPAFFYRARPFFEALERTEVTAFTSTLTITELLVKPFQLGQTDKAQFFREILAKYVEIAPVTYEIAELAAQPRADHNFRAPDAIQIATAINHQADAFLTNDVSASPASNSPRF
jgi:predicted nucleic acid-binding protein